MKLHGGQYAYFYSKSQVTHMIASNLPDSKIKDIGKNEKVVRPQWITDSIDTGKLLSCQDYLLYANTSRSQRQLSFHSVVSTMPFSLNSTTDEHDTRLIDIDADSVFEKATEHNDSLSLFTNVNVIPEKRIESCEHINMDTESITGFSTAADIEACSANDVDSEEVKSGNAGVETAEQIMDISPAADCLTSCSLSETLKIKNIPKTNNATFVKEFYNNSRLHFLSTWGAEFRDYMANLYAQKAGHLAAHRKQYDSSRRTIFHVDMDCFFVSVSLRDKPWLRGKPVGVCHARNKSLKSDRPESRREQDGDDIDKVMESAETEARLAIEPWWKVDGSDTDKVSHAEVASCSYEARDFGIRNGMFLGKALKLCPQLQLVPYEFEKYRATAQGFYDTLASYTLEIQAVSCDEAYMDVTHIVCEGQDAGGFAEELRRDIYNKTGCNASIGIGPNILLARMATRKAKPNGQFLLTKEAAIEYMMVRPVSDLPGVGYSTKSKLESFGISVCADLQSKSLSWLQSEFGQKSGRSLYQSCRGIDEQPLRIVRERKSVSAEINYGIRFEQESDVNEFMRNLAVEIHSRLNTACVKGKQITLKMKIRAGHAPMEPVKYMGHGVCDNVSRSLMVASATDDSTFIASESLKLFKQLKVPFQDVRGMGIQLSKLVSTRHRLANSGPALQSRMQRDITSFTCNIAELDDNVPARDQTKRSVLRKQHAKDSGVPPLPLLPLSPEGNSNDRVGALGLQDSISKAASSHNISWDIPPSSQVDPSVLAALPDDIRKPIENAYCKRGIAVCDQMSSGSSKGTLAHTRQATKQAAPATHSLPPFSEIDPEYLSALPPGMRKEILDAYSIPSITQPLTSRKSSKAAVRTGAASKSTSRRKATTLLQPPPIVSSSSQSVSSSSNATVTSNPESASKTRVLKQPTLLGVFELADVRSVVKQWIASTDDPEEVDVEEFETYIDKLMENWKLDMIVVLLKLFRRQVMEKAKWCKVYNEVLTYIQQRVSVEYGGLLQLTYI
ncbi:DNA repair protein REV1-like isoform X2 [Corticium candelabrum]|nr:DNA repair protein REV1-like isoform X2 [Corticium candelabrum]